MRLRSVQLVRQPFYDIDQWIDCFVDHLGTNGSLVELTFAQSAKPLLCHTSPKTVRNGRYLRVLVVCLYFLFQHGGKQKEALGIEGMVAKEV